MNGEGEEMQDINNVTLVGRLTRDAELKYTQSGTAISRLSIATNRRTKKGDERQDRASFFDCTLWGKAAEGLDQYLRKGKQVAIQGELQQDRWEKDGQKHSKVAINIREIELLGGRSEVDNQASPAQTPTSYEAQSNNNNDFEDDIPF